jgi:hypothetical protein
MHIFGELGIAALGCLKILPDICLERESEIKENRKVASNLRKIQASYPQNTNVGCCHHCTFLQNSFVTVGINVQLIILSV